MAVEEVTVPRPQRRVPWQRVGTPVKGLMTAKEAIRKADLDWKVIKEQLYVPDPGGKFIEVPNRMAIIRDTDSQVMGLVGKDYNILQNLDAFDFMDALVDSGEAKYDSCGPLRSGRWVFMSVKFPKEIMIAGVDPIDLYGVLWNSHDGTKAVTLMVTPVRPVCENTLQLGLRQAVTQFSVRHTTSLQGRLQEARDALQLTFNAADAWTQEMEKLAATKYSDSEFEKLVSQLTDAPRSQEGLKQTWATSETVDRETRYGAFNAVTEYVDWTRNAHGAPAENAQMMSTLFGNGARMRNKAFGLLAVA